MKGKRTAIFALLLEIFGVLEAFEWTSVMGSKTAGVVVIVISVLVFLLRTVTDTAIFKSIGGGGIDTGN